MARKSLGNAKRFKIFERDGFCCQYCGRDPITFDIVLEVDHAISVHDGGGNDMRNLVTSCFECNRGKSKKSVVLGEDSKIDQERDKLIAAKERLKQIKKINSIRERIQRVRHEQEVAMYGFVHDKLEGYTEGLKDKILIAVKSKAKKGVGLITLRECLDIALRKFQDYDEFYTTDFVKYFYGVVRGKESEDCSIF